MIATTLTPEEEMKATKVAGSIMGGLCIGAAKLMKGAGFIAEHSTGIIAGTLHMTATGINWVADGVDDGGQIASKFCYDKAESLEKTAKEYDLSDVNVDTEPKHNDEDIIDAGALAF